MENSKPWHQSKRFRGFIVSFVGIITLILDQKYNIKINFDTVQVSNIVGQILTWGGQAMALYGSAVAEHKLTLK